MSMTDPIADMLTRIRNAQSVKKLEVEMPVSNKKISILKVLKEEGYIEGYEVTEASAGQQRILKVFLKYYQGEPVIELINRISKPGLRVYCNKDTMPKVLEGLGVAIISTSKGVMSDRQARAEGVGGEIICTVV